MLPHVWVGVSTSSVRFESKINSQKLSDAAELPDRVDQLISGRLKSPRIKTGLDKAMMVVK